MKLFLCTFSLILLFTPAFSVRAQNIITEPFKILLVPGHDKESFGSQYGFLREADMNMSLAQKIYDLLNKDSRFEVHITRDKNGYMKEFVDFFQERKDSIADFIESSKINMQGGLINGLFTAKSNTPHGAASEDMVTRLYGFNKWANENKMDAVVHIHFNDYKRKTKWKMGDRQGFVVYIPDEQFVNSEESLKLGDSIFIELDKKYNTSNYVNELGGMVFDQKLIALGANRTLVASVPVVLVEYGYIYKFGNKEKRLKDYTQMAELTVEGLENYFFNPELSTTQ